MHPQRIILIAALLIAVGYVWLRGGFIGLADSFTTSTTSAPAAPAGSAGPGPGEAVQPQAPAAPALPPTDTPRADGLVAATFASGCFWCTEADFDKLPGVMVTTSGYTGGRIPNPTYRQVTYGTTGHAEAVHLLYNPAVVTYEQLLDLYWHNVDPFTANRQFCDTGDQYRPEIFVHSEAQRAAAEASKARMQQQFRERVVVRITPAAPFYLAEDYHQDYYKKNSAQYRFYRYGCGRDARLDEIWGR